jgi:Ca2+-binding RTX toxin-like protein
VHVTSVEQQDVLDFVVNGTGDELHVLGTPGPDNMLVTRSIAPNSVRTIVDGFPTAVDITNGGKLVLFGLGDADTITATNGIASTGTLLEIDGGAGDDTLTGGDGDDVIFGGGGDDVVRGGIGADVMNLGGGNDTAVWNPGDGSDTVEGDGGSDVLQFNGSNAAETMDLSANGTRARLFRNIASITMDLNAVEAIQIQARGSADDITVNDLSATDVRAVSIDLSSQPGATPPTGDGAIDTVRVNGTDDPDKFSLAPTATGVSVSRAKGTAVSIDNPETTDQLVVNGLGGTDKFVVDPGVSAAMALTLNPD